jgi:hypothetical protein
MLKRTQQNAAGQQVASGVERNPDEPKEREKQDPALAARRSLPPKQRTRSGSAQAMRGRIIVHPKAKVEFMGRA